MAGITIQGGIDRAESNRRRQAFLAWIDARGYYRKGGCNRHGQIAYQVVMPDGKRQWIHTCADRWIPGEYDDLDPTSNQSIMQCIRRMTNRVENTRIP